MDPLTQGLIGASAPQLLTSKCRSIAWAGCFGLIAGMAPDLDVLIRSSSDPLLFLEYHRQFSHSIIFIPIGGLLIAGILHFLFRKKTQFSFRESWIFCTLGFGTHGCLDSFTSYGTMLWWPFNDERVALNIVSIVDPLFTIPVCLLLCVGVFRSQKRYSAAALVWATVYLSVALMQRERVTNIGYQIAEGRGHSPSRLFVKPSFGNILVWKVIYEANGHFFVDAVRAGTEGFVIKGESVRMLNLARDFPRLNRNSRQAKDVRRFERVTNGYLAVDPVMPARIIDIRYSMIPNKIDPLWSIEIQEQYDASIKLQSHRRDSTEKLLHLWSLIIASD